MTLIPQDKRWTQLNDGDSAGVINSSWGIDLKSNRGKLRVSKPLKNVLDTTDDADFVDEMASIEFYKNKLWAVSDEFFKVSASGSNDITTGWAQDAISNTPTVGSSVTDTCIFNDLLLVVDNDDIAAFNDTTWTASWWKGTLSQSGLTTGKQFILQVGPDGNLYIVDGGNKVHKVDKANVAPAGVSIAGTDTGTLDFSATQHTFVNTTITSDRIFYGTEDEGGEDCVVIEWDMAPDSISPNKIHPMGAKRVLQLMTWNDTVIAILSDGSVKYHNGNSFVEMEGMSLPKTKYIYKDDVTHKNGWDIIDNLPHFNFNPTVENNDTAQNEDSSNYWNNFAGVYCIDPQLGVYNRFPFTDADGQVIPNVSTVGALKASGHRNANFLTSYAIWSDGTNRRAVLAVGDILGTVATKASVILNPIETTQGTLKKVELIHKKLGTGDSINCYYRKEDKESIRITGYWSDSKTFNTTDSITGLEKGWVGFTKLGVGAGYLSTVADFNNTGATRTITFKDTNSDVTLNDYSVIELVNFKYFGTISDAVQEFHDLTIPDGSRSRNTWLWLEMKQAAGNQIEIDYLNLEA